MGQSGTEPQPLPDRLEFKCGLCDEIFQFHGSHDIDAIREIQIGLKKTVHSVIGEENCAVKKVATRVHQCKDLRIGIGYVVGLGFSKSEST